MKKFNENELAEALDNYTNPEHPEYDAGSDKGISGYRPDWFTPEKSDGKKTANTQIVQEIIENMVRLGDPVRKCDVCEEIIRWFGFSEFYNTCKELNDDSTNRAFQGILQIFEDAMEELQAYSVDDENGLILPILDDEKRSDVLAAVEILTAEFNNADRLSETRVIELIEERVCPDRAHDIYHLAMYILLCRKMGNRRIIDLFTPPVVCRVQGAFCNRLGLTQR